MNLTKYFRILFILLSSFVFTQANQLFSSEYEVLQMNHNHNFTVKEFTENKIYLHEDKIYPTQNGIYLFINEQNDFVILPHLRSNSKGCFVDFTHQNFGLTGGFVDLKNKCPGCKRPYIISCDNPICPLRITYEQRKAEKKAAKQKRKNS